jgi:hypothetical protein
LRPDDGDTPQPARPQATLANGTVTRHLGSAGVREYDDHSIVSTPMGAPRLQWSMVALSAVTLIVALAASVAFLVLTTVLSHEAARMGVADARMRASLGTKVALRWYAGVCQRV